MTPWLDRLRSRTAAFVHDLVMVPAAWFLAFWTRFNLERIPPDYFSMALHMLPVVVLLAGLMYWAFGLYRGVWRFASLPDLVRILKAVAATTLAVVVVLFVINRSEHLPRSVPPLFFVFQLLLLAGPRLLYRWLKDHRLSLGSGTRVLIVGAGRAGEMLVRDMRRAGARRYEPVAFVDDKLRRHGAEIHGVPIRGGTELIPRLTQELGIDLILLAIPSASAAEMGDLVRLCERTGKPFRTVPKLENLMTGQVSISQLRPVSIEDLLGRNPVTLDWDGLRAGLAGRVVLVTGAGGSIGSELCRQVVAARPRRLLLLDNCEFNLYRIEQEFAERADAPDLGRYLLDVGDRTGVDALFARERPQIVFHAAAYKHVPLLEDQVRAAVRNNVLGTGVVADSAHRHRCERFVLISTDKAVNPANVMGASKRAAEILCQGLAVQSPTRFITVRFGNVLGSAGSVVPLFQRQIERGGPVTVTDPDVERYFMTIPEACQLIMQAAVIGAGGEIFVLDMGEPVKISRMAEQMIRLAGREPGRDIAIEYIGLRPGEKRFEELFYDAESLTATVHPKIRIARRLATDADAVAAWRADLADCIQRCDIDALAERLREIVPQWQPAGTHYRAGAPEPSHV
ncbi:MAG: polysaccharide biosynthesis protein [Thiohalocapsa sp.]|jgi:FlaA1/EpsC-like NDP-sugar epimerase|uniref:polysaccharide biosynthesis protein n=1 Tax=Thiohalocapsa sp. TaxID=2497641 RepID=UPI0025EA6390|nr:nucleoside-diphosphate sugar epimerase/dehydratase [Thiohalocapsa sp.]MCG6941206.1 polysaccharide biosynthesis protein [Thiohalocapsa sp.]